MTSSDLEIRLVLHGGLGGASAPAPDGHVIAVSPGTTLAEALERLGVDRGLIGVASRDGELLRPDTLFESDCTVDVYPIFGGG